MYALCRRKPSESCIDTCMLYDHEAKQALNVIIKGVPEILNKKMHVNMSEILAPVQPIIYTQTNGATQIGKPPKPTKGRNTTQPRPIKLRCPTVLQKGVLFCAIPMIQQIQKFKNVKIMNELSKDDLVINL